MTRPQISVALQTIGAQFYAGEHVYPIAHGHAGEPGHPHKQVNCRPTTLERICRTHSNPDYFFQALAAHENTLPEILIDLYRRPVTISGLDRSLARNPAVPKVILREIATTTRDSFVIQQLLQNPELDCALVGPIELALQGSERPKDSFSLARLQELKSGQCKLLSGTR